MIAVATAPPETRSWSVRWQGALAIASLVAAALGTVALVAAPVSSAASGGSAATAPAPLAGLRVEVRGGEPFLAYGVGDRLARAGAAVGSVQPAASAEVTEDIPAVTTIEYHDRESLAAAGRIREMLGRGTLRRRQVFRPVVDVTIVLGKDLSRL